MVNIEIPVRWVRRRQDKNPDTGLPLDVISGSLSMLDIPESVRGSPPHAALFAEDRSLSCKVEADRYRKGSVRVWSGEIPTPEEARRLPPGVQARYREALAFAEIVRVWEEQAKAWAQLADAIRGRGPRTKEDK